MSIFDNIQAVHKGKVENASGEIMVTVVTHSGKYYSGMVKPARDSVGRSVITETNINYIIGGANAHNK